MVFVHFPPSSGRGRKGQIEGGPRSHPVCPSVPVSLLVHEPTRGASPSSSGGLPQQADFFFRFFVPTLLRVFAGKWSISPRKPRQIGVASSLPPFGGRAGPPPPPPPPRHPFGLFVRLRILGREGEEGGEGSLNRRGGNGKEKKLKARGRKKSGLRKRGVRLFCSGSLLISSCIISVLGFFRLRILVKKLGLTWKREKKTE